MSLDVKRTPDAVGWWARRLHGKIHWLRVEQVEPEAAPGTLVFVVWMDVLLDWVPLAQLSKPPGVRWYGPVVMPEAWEEG